MSRAKPKRPGAYERISRDLRGLELGVSRQKEDLERLAANLGWGNPVHYVENDTSASKGKARPVFEQLKADYIAGKIDGILVYSLDRLTRRMSELVDFVEWVQTTGCPVETIEGDDFRTANGRGNLHMKGVFAQQEAERISERSGRALLAKARKGEKPTGGRRFGYTADMEIVQEEAEVIRSWVKHLLSGGSIGHLVERLNLEGCPPPRGSRGRGKRWYPSTVRRILANPALAGMMDYTHTVHYPEKTVVTERFKGNWKPIISVAKHEAVKAVLSSHRGIGEHKPRRYLLSGVATCGECGSALYGAPDKRDPGGYVYRCRKQFGGCGEITRTGRIIDVLISFAVVATLEAKQDEEGPLGASDDQQIIEDLSAEIDKIERKIDTTRKAYEEDQISDADYFATLRNLRHRQKEVRREVATREKEREQREAAARYTDETWNASSLEEQREMLRALLAQIVVHKAGGRGGPFRADTIWFQLKGSERMLTFRWTKPYVPRSTDLAVEIIYAGQANQSEVKRTKLTLMLDEGGEER
ncbi:recombinase family protein [Nonomuraea sp. NPDC050328]|uniref:recombinase family protein n=1 Tax=Nonomuraea sp. NPDC050328 TaxID=3364361 RepID=UPI0037B9F2E2